MSDTLPTLLHRLRTRLGLDGADPQRAVPQRADEAALSAPPPPTLLEWGVRLASALLVLALMGYVSWQGLRPSQAATFRFDAPVAQAQADGPRWQLPVAIRNEGSHAVQDLAVVAELRQGERVVDSAAFTLPLLGPGEAQSLTLLFDEEPRGHQLHFDVQSYRAP